MRPQKRQRHSADRALPKEVLHILVNNAGVTAPGMFADLTDESFQRVFDIHLMGAVHCAQAALGFLPTDGTGRIINVVSSAGITGTAGPGELLGGQGEHHRVHQVTGA